jgi:hypothetical protein
MHYDNGDNCSTEIVFHCKVSVSTQLLNERAEGRYGHEKVRLDYMRGMYSKVTHLNLIPGLKYFIS